MDSLVAPAIANLMQAYPELSPELISEDQHLDFMEHNIDLAIRVGTSKDSNHRQKRLGVFHDVLCASAPIPATKKLEDMPYIANSWQGKNIIHQFQSKQGKKFIFEAKPSCVVNSFHSCLSLISSGAGIGLIPSFYYAKAEGELVDVLPEMKQAENPIYAVYPYSNQPINVKVCITAIEQELAQHQYLTN
jgi:DNA-binding transcriptional LysR family regulator